MFINGSAGSCRNLFFYSHRLEEIKQVLSANFGIDSKSLEESFKDYEEEAFVRYGLIPISKFDYEGLEAYLYMLRDLLVVSVAGYINGQEKEELEALRDTEEKIAEVFRSGISRQVGEQKLLFKPIVSGEEPEVEAREMYGREASEYFSGYFGRIYLIGLPEEKPDNCLFLYEEAFGETAGNFMLFELPVLNATLKKANNLITNYQQKRYETIKMKQDIDENVRQAVSELGHESELYARMNKLEHLNQEMSERITWLSKHAERPKNLATGLKFCCRQIDGFFERYDLKSGEFLKVELFNLQEYMHQAEEDYNYLLNSCSAAENVVASVRNDIELVRNQIQSMFYKRMTVLVVLAVVVLIAATVIYLQS